MVGLKIHGPNMAEVTTPMGVFYFSYETCMAWRGYSPLTGDERAIRLKSPSVTTSKHLKKMSCDGFELVPKDVFDTIITGK